MNMREFRTWLKQYGEAWETGDPMAAAALFTDHAEYIEAPFDPPMVGREEILRYWTEGAAEGQRDVHCAFDPLSVTRNSGIAHWHATFTRESSGRARLPPPRALPRRAIHHSGRY